MYLRHLRSEDFDVLSPLVDEWWGGRPVRHLVHRLFFEHFSTTSFALAPAHDDADIRGFLIGFRSPAHPHVAYIHFVGVSPAERGAGHARRLYGAFFDHMASQGCTEVHAITSPANAASIAFHRALGFTLVEAGGHVDGVPVRLDHAGEGQHRVLFRLTIPHSPIEPPTRHCAA